ncbi:HlyD family efflux transporter periplasmic adaptor subunit [Limnohabitans sp. DCL3]|uniref:HlyD family efflux transporter periplasmic adaptor subunit n=1 Tax=Limnohabitans sp. DCL3 TaxID=3374103 RepID=UPI003A85219B
MKFTAPSQPGHLLGDLAPPRGARRTLRVILLALVALITWAAVAHVDQVTRAPAQLIVSARTQLVQSADGGVVTRLHVQEGDRVTAGQLLVTLQKERASAAVADSAAKVAALKITLSRLQAEVYERPLMFAKGLQKYEEYIQNQSALYDKRRSAFLDDLSAVEQMLRLARAELVINQKLEATGDVSQADLLRLQRMVADLEAQKTNKRNKYFQDAQAEMTKAQEELNTQIELLRDRSQVLEQTELLAPMDGVVNNVKVNTVGGVVRPGDTVLELLPDANELVAEAKVATADIAFVLVGQEAQVRLDAYDSSIFGSMRGQVRYISPDVISEDTRNGPFLYYRVRIHITGTEFKGPQAHQIQMRPGLTAQVDIKALERSVLSYLLKPVAKTLSQSFGER